MERKSPDARGDKRGGRFAVGTALLAVASVGYVVLAAPGTEAESTVDENKNYTCKAEAQVKLTKKGSNLEAATSNVEEPDAAYEECEIGEANGKITDVSYEAKGKMCELTSSKGEGKAMEGEEGGKEGVEGEGKAQNAKVTISVPLKDGAKQGKFTAEFVSDPSSPDGSNTVKVQGTFPAGELQMDSCDAASLPDASTVVVKGTASVVPQDK
ncbi:hypothetical protein ACFYV7_25600 [Nocardia suismassiliense]|uniref:Peptidase n=1 Tax=Nocardia suismassiliense TaxID=2077092 RepID=A0ABW6QY55_9NOCA